jgi:hypothetical protein
LEYRTEAFKNSITDEEFVGLKMEGYVDFTGDESKRSYTPKDLLISSPFTFEGYQFPGALVRVYTDRLWRVEGRSAQGHKSHGGLLTRAYAQLKSASLPVLSSEIFNLHSSSPLWDYVGGMLTTFCKNADPDLNLTPGVLFSAGTEQTEGFVAGNQQGKELVGECPDPNTKTTLLC